MYASIRRYEVNPASAREIAKRANEGFLPILRNLPGFVAYHLVDAGGGVMASISIFEDRIAAEQSNREAAVWVGENLAAYVSSPPEITAGELVVTSS